MVLLETTNGMEALPKEAALSVDRPVIEVAAHTGHQVEVPEAILRAEVLEVTNHLVALRPEAVDTAALEEVHGVQAATAVRLQEAAQEARAAIEVREVAALLLEEAHQVAAAAEGETTNLP